MSDNEACDNGYEDIDEEEYNAVEEYQEAEGDVCVQEDYEEPAEEEQEPINTVEEEEDEQVQIHGEDDIVFSQETEAHDAVAAENEEVSQDEEETQDGDESQGEPGEKDPEDQNDPDGETEKQEDKEEEEKEEKEEEVVCTFTEEEILAEYKILDGYQREIDEEHYTLRKLRSIIGHQSDNIERMRKKIADYTKSAQDRKAMDAMDGLKTMKAERERAVEERSISTETLADVRGKRSERVAELKTKGLKIPSSSSYLIEDTQLKTLYSDIRSILKYNSFAVLKHGMDELDEVIFSVANICDDIDGCLTTRNLKPRDINKLNTKDRRVSVLYDKLLKWRLYKVADPDIRPTDYESFMYDPDDMFSDSEEEKEDKRESRREGSRPKREIRAVRGGDTPPRSRDKTHKRTKNLFQSAHSPIRPPTPPPTEEKSPAAARASKSASPPARAATKSKSPVRPAIVRRAVRGGSPDAAEDRSKERPLRAERVGETAGPRRDQPIRKRRAEPIESDSYKRRQQFSPPRRQPMRRSPVRKERHHSPRDDRRPSPPRNRGGPPRRDNNRGRARTTLLSTPPIKPAHSFDTRRSPSPPFRNRNRENFQISVRNETYRPRSPGRRDDRFRDDQRGPMMRDDRPMQQQQHRSPGYRGRGRGAGPPGRRQDDRREDRGTYRR